MTAAEITPSIVSKTYLGSSSIKGTPKRIIEYYLETTKSNQNDWILLETAIGETTKTLMGATGIVLDSSSDLTEETLTYDDSEDKLVCAGSATGTVKIFVRMAEAQSQTMTAATLTSNLEVNDPTVEVVILTISDNETYVSKKFGTVTGVNFAFNEDMSTLAVVPGFAISGSTITFHCTGVTDKLVCVTLYGKK